LRTSATAPAAATEPRRGPRSEWFFDRAAEHTRWRPRWRCATTARSRWSAV